MRRPTRVPHALTAALCATLLAGCGGSPQASDPPDPRPTTSDSPASSPSPTRDALTRQGARDFVERYIAALNEAMTNGETAEVVGLDDGTCKSCKSTVAAIQDIYEAGGAIQGGAWTPTVIDQLPRRDGWVVDVELKFTPQVVTEADGNTKRYRGGTGLASFIVTSEGTEWQVDEWTRAN